MSFSCRSWDSLQGQEGQEFGKRQAELNEDLSGLKDRMDAALSEEQRGFVHL